MKKELDALLCERYPKIFLDRHQSIKETCMVWGFSCGDGWFDLIDTLCERLQFWIDHNKAPPPPLAAQVKEEWGELCFYPNIASEEQWGMISMADAMFARICDQCGKLGQTLEHGFWHMTRFVEHAP